MRVSGSYISPESFQSYQCGLSARERGGRPRLRAGVDGAFTALVLRCAWRGCTSTVANGVGCETDGGKPRAREVGHEAAPGLL